jgi:predicted HicB family RNase H-like nuclease
VAEDLDTVLFTRLPRELRDRAQARAAEVGIPVAEWVRRALTHALDEPIREYTVPTVERV